MTLFKYHVERGGRSGAAVDEWSAQGRGDALSARTKIDTLVLAGLVGMCMTLVPGCPLRIVDVSAPGINCKFDRDCTITVNDSSDHFVLPAHTGDAFLQSRLSPPGETGTAGVGLFAYEYRLDLRNLVGAPTPGCIRKMKVDFGPIRLLDYNDDGIPDHVYVVTGGGLGTVAPTSAKKVGHTITFEFNPPVCAGSSPGAGESSFFFGLASKKDSRAVNARVEDTLGSILTLDARAPQLP